jgi:hypothetical protein
LTQQRVGFLPPKTSQKPCTGPRRRGTHVQPVARGKFQLLRKERPDPAVAHARAVVGLREHETHAPVATLEAALHRLPRRFEMVFRHMVQHRRMQRHAQRDTREMLPLQFHRVLPRRQPSDDHAVDTARAGWRTGAPASSLVHPARNVRVCSQSPSPARQRPGKNPAGCDGWAASRRGSDSSSRTRASRASPHCPSDANA